MSKRLQRFDTAAVGVCGCQIIVASIFGRRRCCSVAGAETTHRTQRSDNALKTLRAFASAIFVQIEKFLGNCTHLGDVLPPSGHNDPFYVCEHATLFK